MAVQSFCRLVGHGNPAPSPWCKRFFLLAQQCFGSTYEPLFLVWSWCFGCRKTKNLFKTRLWLRTSTGTALVEKGYHMLYNCACSNQHTTLQQDTEPGSVQQLKCLGSYEIVFTVDLELNITQTNHPNYDPMTCVCWQTKQDWLHFL